MTAARISSRIRGFQERDNAYMPEWIALNDEGAKTWPLRDKGRTERSILVDNLASPIRRSTEQNPFCAN